MGHRTVQNNVTTSMKYRRHGIVDRADRVERFLGNKHKHIARNLPIHRVESHLALPKVGCIVIVSAPYLNLGARRCKRYKA